MPHHTLLYRLVVCVLLLAVFSGALQAQDAAAWEVLELINNARAAAGVHPLAMNGALVAAAQAHSDDMAAGDFLSHTGSDGSAFWQRMMAAGYPLTSGAENVLFRWDTNAASVFQQWMDSPPHRENMLSPAYVEVGIASAQSDSGRYYFTIVLGARAGVDPLPSATPVSLNTPLPTSTPQPTWTAAAQQPAVQPTQPPDPGPVSTAASAAQPSPTPWPTATTPPLQTSTPRPVWLSLLQPFLQETTVILNITADLALRAGGIAIVDNPAQLTPAAAPPDIRLLYGPDGLALINTSGRSLDLRGLVFSSAEGSMFAERWDTPGLSRPLDFFPSGDCLQVWGLGSAGLERPAECAVRHGWVAVNDAQIFWRAAAGFSVMREGVVLANCAAEVGRCDVHFSSASVGPSSVQQPAAPASSAGSAGGDIRLVYSRNGLTLINTSGRELDISQLAFESDAGVMLASRWDTPGLSRPLTAFPWPDCLQVWGVDAENIPPLPEDCRLRHAWIAVGFDQQFWVNVGSFRVRRGAELLATCSLAAGLCDFLLP